MATTDYRILVTGWRRWGRAKAWYVQEALSALAILKIGEGYRHIIVVEGECPDGGVDLFARQWAEAQPFADPERHPAQWAKFGRAAGAIRNKKMVDLGANICLAFPGPSSRGTTDCMKQASAAGIRVVELPWHEAVRMEPSDDFFEFLQGRGIVPIRRPV